MARGGHTITGAVAAARLPGTGSMHFTCRKPASCWATLVHAMQLPQITFKLTAASQVSNEAIRKLFAGAPHHIFRSIHVWHVSPPG